MKTHLLDNRPRLVALAVVSALSCSGWAGAASFRFSPTLSVGEEYTDNIFQTSDGSKSEFTTRVRPGGIASYDTSFLKSDAAYTYDYRHYANGSHGDQQFHDLDLKGNAELLDHFFYLDVQEGMHRMTVDVARDVASEGLLVNQTTRNSASVSGYLRWRPMETGTLRTGYRYADTRYWSGAGNDKRENGFFAEFDQNIYERLSLYAAYVFTRGEIEQIDYDRQDVQGGFKFLYADNSFLYCRLGNSWENFLGIIRTSNRLWDAGLSHDFRGFTVLLETKVQNVEDPLNISTREVSYTGRVDRPFNRGALGLAGTYAEFYYTQTGEVKQRHAAVTGTGRYDLMPRLSVSAALKGDRFSRKSEDDYPYRLTASASVNYGFYNEFSAVSAGYTFQLDRRDLTGASAGKVTNKVIVEVRTQY